MTDTKTNLEKEMLDLAMSVKVDDIDKRSNKLIDEVQEHVKLVKVDCPSASLTDISAGWMLQKIASLQLVVESQQAQIVRLIDAVK